MPHVFSDDVTTGNTYDGTWTVNEPIYLSPLLIYHFVDSTDIPWIYPGVQNLEVFDGVATTSIVTFPTLSSAKTDATQIAALKLAFDTGLALLPLTPTVTIVHDAANDQFTLTFTSVVSFLWAGAGTSSQPVWNTVGAAASPLSVNQVLSTRYVDSRPDVMEIEFVDVETTPSTRTTSATLFLPLQDYQVSFRLNYLVDGGTVTLEWRRINIPVACPMTNQWHLWFE